MQHKIIFKTKPVLSILLITPISIPVNRTLPLPHLFSGSHLIPHTDSGMRIIWLMGAGQRARSRRSPQFFFILTWVNIFQLFSTVDWSSQSIEFLKKNLNPPPNGYNGCIFTHNWLYYLLSLVVKTTNKIKHFN